MKLQTEFERQNELMKIGRRVFLAGLVVTATGCKNIINRGQSPDDTPIVQLYDDKKNQSGYIGDICGIDGLNFAKVEGAGLVVQLNGAGSVAQPGAIRQQLLRDLEMNTKYDSPKKMVASKDTEVVLIAGLLPPGIREGESFDLIVETLKNTDAKSIENGTLLQARMRPTMRTGRSVKQGNVAALGKGRVLTNALFETRQDKSNQLRGVILGGGKALKDRPLGLNIRTESFSSNTTIQMARAINARFTTIGLAGRKGVAEPKNDRRIDLMIPDNYRHNIGRYLSVVENIAYAESVADRVNRMEELDREIGEPSKSALASRRLEALGKDGIPALKRALRHHDLEVQFHAAEALAYSGQADGVEILEKSAREEPAFRWHALAALASLDDVTAGIALSDLMHVPSAETRYGAFRALRARSPQDPTVTGDWLAGDFFLHEIPSQSEGMVHFSKSKRPEIVIFGEGQKLGEDFLHVEPGGLTVRGNPNGTVSISRFSVEFGEEKKVCSNEMVDVIRTLAKMGYGYSPLLKMFREANQAGSLQARLVVNAIPKLGREYTPGQTENELPPEQSDRYVADPMPELFRTGNQRPTKVARVEEDVVGGNDAEIREENKTRWTKMKDWLTGNKTD